MPAANPCGQATKPKVSTAEIEPPPPEWVRSIIAAAEGVNDDLAVCVRLAAATGARRGEAVALKWSDFNGGRLTIRRSLVESEGRLIERRTKTGTKGHRTIAVDADTPEAVEALRVRRDQSAHPDVAWREISGIRVILAHAYFHIEHDIVGNVIDHDVPLLRAQLQVIVDSFGDGD